jgi:N-acetylmuramoyl-L-alanine amidase
MKGIFTTTAWIAVLFAGLAAGLFYYTGAASAADSDFPIYLEDSTIILKTQAVKGVLYLPLADIVRNFTLPYTNDTTQESFTIRGANSQVVLTRNSASISVNGQSAAMPSPVLHDNGIWLVPVEFLQQGLSRLTSLEFRRRTGSPRAFSARVKATELNMSAQSQATLTRLTFRTANPVTLELKREASPRRAILVFAPKPIDPTRENLDSKDRLVQSVDFDDSDGSPRVIVGLSEEVGEIRILSADENRAHFVDILRKTELTDTAPPQAPATGKGMANVRVIVIDPGHGGIDNGAGMTGALEKDLTLAVARKLRTMLQSRFGATVLLTRDSDVALTSEARAAVANNNRADLFISLHMGYSTNKSDLGSSVYVMQENFAASSLPTTEKTQRLFQPWYLGYQKRRESSVKVATILSEDLTTSMPGWNFPVRSGPAAVLASTIMPAVLIEVGNLNNPTSTQALMDDTFQTRLSSTIAGAVERYAAPKQAAP